MTNNIGSIDKIIRVIVAAAIAVLYFTNQISGTAAIILGILAAVFVLTSFVSFCPLYMPFKLSTVKKNNLSVILNRIYAVKNLKHQKILRLAHMTTNSRGTFKCMKEDLMMQ